MPSGFIWGRQVGRNEEADLFLIIPRVPTNNSGKAQSVDGVSCCCQRDYWVCISTANNKQKTNHSISFLAKMTRPTTESEVWIMEKKFRHQIIISCHCILLSAYQNGLRSKRKFWFWVLERRCSFMSLSDFLLANVVFLVTDGQSH
jgi:hypothetical protein